jgi:hypothetical protein
MPRWVNDEKARYYQAHLIQDLFGEWTLIAVWGGLGSRRGGMHSTGVASYADGLKQLAAIGKRRRQRGYRCADAQHCDEYSGPDTHRVG